MAADYPTDEKYILYADKRKAFSYLNKLMLFVLVPMMLLSFLVFRPLAHGFTIPIHAAAPSHTVRQVRVQLDPLLTAIFTWFPWFLLAECALVYWAVTRSVQKQSKPVVTLSAEGIEIGPLGPHLGPIHWDEIEEVRSFTMIHRFVGIVPKSSTALCQRLGKRRAWIISLNAMCVPLYKLFGLFVAPICISQTALPVTADELRDRIHAYQLRYSQKNPRLMPAGTVGVDVAIWPPPPTEMTPQ